MSTLTSRRESTERILVGTLTALVIARFLINGSDPSRLVLTSGGGPLTLNLLSFALLFAWSVWRAIYRVPFLFGPGLFIVGGLLFTAVWTGISTAQPDRYRHPGPFIAWDWAALAVLVLAATQLVNTPARQRGMIAVIVATGTCVVLQASYSQWVDDTSLPTPAYQVRVALDQPFVGDVAGCQNRPPTNYFSILALTIFPAFVWAVAGFDRGGRARLLLVIPFTLMAGLLTITPRLELPTRLFNSLSGNFLWGAGPGNLNPHQLQLEIGYWTEMSDSIGIFPPLILLVVIASAILISLCSRTKVTLEEPRTQTPWEFYGGAVTGLLLGLVLSTGDIPAEARAEELLRAGAVAGVRAIVWFFLFSLMEQTIPVWRILRRALIIAVVVALLGSELKTEFGITTNQQTFWLMLLLALPIAQPAAHIATVHPVGMHAKRDSAQPAARIGSWLAVPFTLALLIGNLLHVGYPGLATASTVRRARQASVEYPYAKWKIPAKPGPEKVKGIRDAKSYLELFILKPLHDAVDKDPGNTTLMLELARWKREQWNYQLDLREGKPAMATGLEILSLAEKAAKLDPRNRDARWSVFESLLVFTRENAIASKGQLASLDKYIVLLAADEPDIEVELRHRVLQTILPKQNQDAIDLWTVKVLELESVKGQPHGRLELRQREALLDAVTQAVPQPSAELSDWLRKLRTK